MSRFRRQKHEVPGLNLAALPDLIFTVLFFFMIVTHMRVVTPLVHVETPQGASRVSSTCSSVSPWTRRDRWREHQTAGASS